MVHKGADCTASSERRGGGTMAGTKRFTVSIDETLYDRLLAVTDEHEPRLPKRYVIELALKRLLEEVDGGQLDLGLEQHVQRH